jgi:ribose-phosphate pyrophosphokinase
MFTDEIQVVEAGWERHPSNMLPAKRTNNFFNADLGSYPDGMPFIKQDDLRKYHRADLTVVIRQKSLEGFVTGLFMVDALRERGNKVRRLVLPFIPAARQDRLNPEGDYLFTLKSVAKMINDLNFDDVVVLDPHSTVATALIDRVNVFPIAKMLENTWVGYDAVIAPDKGAVGRAQEAANALNALNETNMPVIHADKTRDVATGKLTGFEVDVEKGKNYLVFDDICDGGGTFNGLGEKIREQGATAGLFVTHGVFSKGTNGLNSYYNAITTTDSTLFDKHDARVIPVVERMINS